MKTWIVSLLASACLVSSMPAFAKVATSDLVLGGVALRSRLSELEALYGTPTRHTATGFWYRLAYYGDTLLVTIDAKTAEERANHGLSRVYGISVRSQNGLATPKGIRVGSTKSEVRAAYGEPDDTQRREFYEYWVYLDGDNPRQADFLRLRFVGDVVTELGIHVNTGE